MGVAHLDNETFHIMDYSRLAGRKEIDEIHKLKLSPIQAKMLDCPTTPSICKQPERLVESDFRHP